MGGCLYYNAVIAGKLQDRHLLSDVEGVALFAALFLDKPLNLLYFLTCRLEFMYKKLVGHKKREANS